MPMAPEKRAAYFKAYAQRPERKAAARLQAKSPRARAYQRKWEHEHRAELTAKDRARRARARGLGVIGGLPDLDLPRIAAMSLDIDAPEEPIGPQDLKPGQHACSRCDLPTRRSAPECGFCAAELVREAVAA